MEDKVSQEVQETTNGDVKKEVSIEPKSEEVEAKEAEVKEEQRGEKQTRVATQKRPQQQSEDFQKRRMYFRKKVCRLCSQKATSVDYKNVDLLRRYITDRGKILPRRITGNCARHQRMLAKAIKRARMAALLPFVSK